MRSRRERAIRGSAQRTTRTPVAIPPTTPRVASVAAAVRLRPRSALDVVPDPCPPPAAEPVEPVAFAADTPPVELAARKTPSASTDSEGLAKIALERVGCARAEVRTDRSLEKAAPVGAAVPPRRSSLVKLATTAGSVGELTAAEDEAVAWLLRLDKADEAEESAALADAVGLPFAPPMTLYAAEIKLAKF